MTKSLIRKQRSKENDNNGFNDDCVLLNDGRWSFIYSFVEGDIM